MKRPSCHDVETRAGKKKQKDPKADTEGVPTEAAQSCNDGESLEAPESEKNFEDDAPVEVEPVKVKVDSTKVEKKPATKGTAVPPVLKKPAAKAAAETKSGRKPAEKISEEKVHGWTYALFRRNTSKTPFCRIEAPDGRVFWSKAKARDAGWKEVQDLE